MPLAVVMSVMLNLRNYKSGRKELDKQSLPTPQEVESKHSISQNMECGFKLQAVANLNLDTTSWTSSHTSSTIAPQHTKPHKNTPDKKRQDNTLQYQTNLEHNKPHHTRHQTRHLYLFTQTNKRTPLETKYEQVHAEASWLNACEG